jgi:hypothetical protein
MHGEEEYETLSLADRSKLFGTKWKTLPLSSRTPYEQRAAADKLRYDNEMRNYIPPLPSSSG